MSPGRRAHAGADVGRSHRAASCPRLPTPHVHLQRCARTPSATRGHRPLLPQARGLGPRGRGRIRSIAAPRDAVGARPCPVRHWHSRVAPWLALPRLRYGGPPRCTPNPCARRRGVQPLRWRIAFWIFDRVAAVSSWSCTAGCAGPAAPPHAAAPPPRPFMLLKPFLVLRPPPPRQVPVGLLQPSGLRGVRRRRSRGSCAYRARSLASRPLSNRLVGAGSPAPRGLRACRPADPQCCSRPHCRNRPCTRAPSA